MITHKAYDDKVQNNNNEVRCPRCGSTSLNINKKTFSLKKAVVGVVLTVGVGILGRENQSEKIMVTCLHCGKQFEVCNRK